MKKKRLTGTSLDWSRIGLGCWAMGGEYWGAVKDGDSLATMERAVAHGINWFDTAPLYGKGRSDKLVGQFARKNAISIATKVGIRWDQQHARSDLSSTHLRNDVPRILKRLQVEHIDLLQVHWPCQSGTSLKETFETLAELREDGYFSHLGVCNYDAAALSRIQKITPIITHQSPYSMVRRAFESTLAPSNAQLGIKSIAYEPLCRGLLTGKYTTRPRFPREDLRHTDERFQGLAFSHIQRILSDLSQVADKVNVPLAALSLGWVLQRSDFVLVGAKTPKQLDENVNANSLIDHKKLWTIVDKILAIHGGVPRL